MMTVLIKPDDEVMRWLALRLGLNPDMPGEWPTDMMINLLEEADSVALRHINWRAREIVGVDVAMRSLNLKRRVD